MSGPLDFEPGGGEAEGGGAPHADEVEASARPPQSRPPGPPPPARPPGASRYGWMVGVLVFVILSYITINTLRSHHIGAAGPKEGTHLHPFAAPLVLSRLDGDANVALHRDSGRAGAVAACSIRRPDVVNLCDLERTRPLVLGFMFTRGAKCTGVFDAMERLRGKMPDVQFAGVVVRGDRDGARKLVREHGWKFPVAFDRDGGVANVYGVAVCPELIFAYPGGVVRDTGIGEGLATDLDRRVSGLVAASKARGWRPPA